MRDDKSLWNEWQEGITKLRFAKMTSVVFVMDYLMLGFDGQVVLTTLVWSSMHSPQLENELTIRTPGYRHRLCSLLGKVVAKSWIDDDDTIHLLFDNADEVRIGLQASRNGGERAILTAADGYLLVY